MARAEAQITNTAHPAQKYRDALCGPRFSGSRRNMNRAEIIAYFNARAAEWDARMVRSDEKDQPSSSTRRACSRRSRCWTWRAAPASCSRDYLARDVSRVTGMDISPEMARIAVSKLHDPRVEVTLRRGESLSDSRGGTTAASYTMRGRTLNTPPAAGPLAASRTGRPAGCGARNEPCGTAPPPRGRGAQRQPADAGAGTPGRADAAVPCGGRRGLGHGKIRRLGAAAVSGVRKVFSKAPAPEPAPFSLPRAHAPCTALLHTMI